MQEQTIYFRFETNPSFSFHVSDTAGAAVLCGPLITSPGAVTTKTSSLFGYAFDSNSVEEILICRSLAFLVLESVCGWKKDAEGGHAGWTSCMR